MFTRPHSLLDGLAVSSLSRPELEAGIGELSRLEPHVVERRLAFTAGINRSRGRRSKKASTKAADTAKQLAAMPATRNALARGEINEEHADAAAAATERTTPQAADTEARFQRQRRLRECFTSTDNDGMLCLYARLDPITAKQLTTRLEQISDRLWRTDSGRDATPNDTPSPNQRQADALTELATPTPTPAATTPAGPEAEATATATAEAALKRPHPKHLIMIAAAIYNADGAVLWQSRTKRLATDDQWNQLITRDKGCDICTAKPAHCEAHHLTPFAPPTNGNTNIDNLILICPTDHHLTHTNSHQLTKTRHGWQLQPTNHQHQQPDHQTAA